MRDTVLVLGGGPDAERDVSVRSAGAVAEALEGAGRRARLEIVDRPSADELRAMPGDVVFPVLHGAYGEGGPLQGLLEADGRPHVGCGPAAARAAMDKMASKLAAARCGIATPPAAVVRAGDAVVGVDPPLVIKPVHEGSSVGLSVCRAAGEAARAIASLDASRAWMAERMIRGRELTVGLLADADGELEPLPIVEVAAASGVYDYDAKYARGDTRYVVAPPLAGETERGLRESALAVARSIGVRDVARADFIVDEDGVAWFLEINTMPGFTASSLLPKAADAAGMSLADVCDRLVAVAMSRAAGDHVR